MTPLYRLQVWFNKQLFKDPRIPDMDVTTTDGRYINKFLDDNQWNIRKHEISCTMLEE